MSSRKKQPSVRLSRDAMKAQVEATLYQLGFALGSWGWHETKLSMFVVVAGQIRTADLRYCLWSRRLDMERIRFIAWAEGMGLRRRSELSLAKSPKHDEKQPSLLEMTIGG